MKFLWAKDVPFGFGLSGNVNATRVTGDGIQFVLKAVTLCVGDDLFAGLSGFSEAFTFAPFDNGTGPNAQRDLTWGHRLNQIGPDQFVQVGLTIRPKVGPMVRY